MKRALALLILAMSFEQPHGGLAAQSPPHKGQPTRIIFDTDIGNDVDDVLALSMLHALQTRGDCDLLAVTITKPDRLAAPFAELINAFYGRPDIPLGCVQPLRNVDPSKFLPLAEMRDGDHFRFPHRLKSSEETPAPTKVLRRILAQQPDGSVVLVQVGYFSNLAAVLETAPDSESPLKGVELVAKKVKLLSVMAGSFSPIGDNRHFLEFNVVKDIPAARKLAKEWPTPIVWSGFEIGIALPFPATSIERDFSYVAHHPAAEAYYLYDPPPHNRPTWDLTSVLYAVWPDRGYFDVSAPGRVTIEEDGFTRFEPSASGRDRYLILQASQVARTKEALVQLASQPPNCLTHR